jgi:hypothetical protein
MQQEIRSITQHLFQKESLDELSIEELDSFISKYPYAAPARFLLAKKKFNANGNEVLPEAITAGLYFNNPLWLQWQLSNNEPSIEEKDFIEVNSGAGKEAPVVKPSTDNQKSDSDSPIAFQSYHTIDYFASQGIRLQQADLTKDKLGQQLKSFTEWLRSMKKLPTAEGHTASPEDDSRQQVVIQNAASSIQEKEVITESMAEVWAKQGNHAKAAEIYHKLSLQNPSKSAYFAAKIDQLK